MQRKNRNSFLLAVQKNVPFSIIKMMYIDCDIREIIPSTSISVNIFSHSLTLSLSLTYKMSIKTRKIRSQQRIPISQLFKMYRHTDGQTCVLNKQHYPFLTVAQNMRRTVKMLLSHLNFLSILNGAKICCFTFSHISLNERKNNKYSGVEKNNESNSIYSWSQPLRASNTREKILRAKKC